MKLKLYWWGKSIDKVKDYIDGANQLMKLKIDYIDGD